MLKQYFQDIFKTNKAGDSTEASFYTDLKNLLNNFLNSKGVDPSITIQPKKTKVGIPDFIIRKNKELIGYVEAKNLGIDLEKIEDSEQIIKYKNKLPNFILTNYCDFWLWRRNGLDGEKGQWIKKVRIGMPRMFDLKIAPPAQNEKIFFELLQTFFSYYLPERKTAKSLAIELASRAQLMPSYIIEELGKTTEINRIYLAFKKFLISDLSKEDFADIYAQTITYGLFTARLRYNDKDFNRFLAQELIPKNIEILREAFSLISGQNLPESINWLVDDIATILAHADIKKIKQELHYKKGGDDPLVHFYETFLAEYDPAKRKARGVYYTPLPVVSYITRSINILLKTKFGKKFGFASHGVTLLDPASGTLTFPANAIKLAKNEIEKSSFAGSWLQIVKHRILKNYYAFELLMAPYIIGHLKIALLLEDLGYNFENSDRFPLYLTNTLDLSEVEQSQLPFVAGLSKEARKARKIKKDKPIMVIMGNPPYSGISQNKGKWILEQIQKYRQIKGKSLGEKKDWLQDDYVKFFRFAQWKIEQAGAGILGFITNHAWLDNPTFRGMRYSLMKTFDEIYILNLHGSGLKKEKTPRSGKDENVFDIQQGVAIAVMIKLKRRTDKHQIKYLDIWGFRKEKYKFLKSHDVQNTKWQGVKPNEPYYFFVPHKEKGQKHYNKFWKITDIFPLNSTGIITARDKFVIDDNKQSLVARIRIFLDKNNSDRYIKGFLKTVLNRKRPEDVENYAWRVHKARKELRKAGDLEGLFIKILYRPFDERWICYDPAIVWRTRDKVMKHMMQENLSLSVTKRHSADDLYNDAFVSNIITEGHLLSGALGITYSFPLYIYDGEKIKKQDKNDSYKVMMLFDKPKHDYQAKKPNINQKLLEALKSSFGEEPSPEKIFYYIYAILYSNIYREKYNEFLKIDFPRIPFTNNFELFKKMSKLGQELVYLHLLKSTKLQKPIASFPIIGRSIVEKREYDAKNKRIYINNKQYFEKLNKEIWNYYIGGYQVLDKWLKDRIGKTLPAQDIKHYLKIITAIKRTIELQKKIDQLYSKAEKSLIKNSLS